MEKQTEKKKPKRIEAKKTDLLLYKLDDFKRKDQVPIKNRIPSKKLSGEMGRGMLKLKRKIKIKKDGKTRKRKE